MPPSPPDHYLPIIAANADIFKNTYCLDRSHWFGWKCGHPDLCFLTRDGCDDWAIVHDSVDGDLTPLRYLVRTAKPEGVNVDAMMKAADHGSVVLGGEKASPTPAKLPKQKVRPMVESCGFLDDSEKWSFVVTRTKKEKKGERDNDEDDWVMVDAADGKWW